MGRILNSREKGGKLTYEVLVNEEENKILKGHMEEINLFSKKNCKHKSEILRRGHKNGAAYLKIPKYLKLKKKKNYCYIRSQKIEEEKNVYYIFSLQKEKNDLDGI